MKILLMNNGYPSGTRPQYSTYIRSIEECLIKAGSEVELLAMSSDFKGKLGKVKQYFIFYWKILSYTRFTEFDIVFINHYPHFAIPFLLRTKNMKQIVFHWHGSDLLPKGKFKKILFHFLIKKLIDKKSNVIHIAPSAYFAGEIANTLAIKKENIIISPSGGIKEENYTPQLSSSVSEKIKIGFASELSPEKGADLFSELVKSTHELEKQFNKKIEFHYIDYGREKEKYKVIFQQNSSTIKWNVLPYGSMGKFYNTIDILIFPTRGESLGLVGLEAMFCNKPVVGTNQFALPEYIIPEVTGEIFEYNNAGSLKSSLLKCANNLSNYNPRTFAIENYSQKKVIDQYKSLFQKAVNNF